MARKQLHKYPTSCYAPGETVYVKRRRRHKINISNFFEGMVFTANYAWHTYKVKYHNGIERFRVSHIAAKTHAVKVFKGESVSHASVNAIPVTKVQICFVQMLCHCLAAEVSAVTVRAMHATTSDAKRRGFALSLELGCCRCDRRYGKVYSSPELPSDRKPSPFVINELVTLLFSRLGLGHTAMKEFCGVLGMRGMHLKTFQKKEL